MAKNHSRQSEYNLSLPFADELIVDNFAGGGGASSGIELGFERLGLTREVAIAINHDGEALAMHAANHPRAKHFVEDVFDIHPGFVTGQQPIGLAWFSPDCRHHSRAKGGKPREQKIRGLAWVALKWATFQAPRLIILENVCEFEQWGPLNAEGKPDPAFRGRTFKAFVAALSSGLAAGHPDVGEIHETLGGDFPIHRLVSGLGYQVEWRALKACDYGAPTTRTRLFLVARRDRRPIVWPKPTHAPRDSVAVQCGSLPAYRSAAECIDWSIACPSIFERKKPLAEATLRRIARGLQKYVLETGDPFTVKFRFDSTGTSIREPLPTITAGSHHKRPGGAAHALGVCQPLLMPFVSTYYGERRKGDVRGTAINDPILTQTTENRHAIVCAFLAQHNKARNGVNPGRKADEPLSTITGRGSQQGVVTARLVGLSPACRGTHATQDASDSQRAVTPETTEKPSASRPVKLGGQTHGTRLNETSASTSAHGLHYEKVREFLALYGNPQNVGDGPNEWERGVVHLHDALYVIVDIGLRMLTPRELARCQGFGDDYVIDPMVKGKRVSQSSQVRMIGNSVSPHPAAALVAANFSHEVQLHALNAA